MTDERSTDPLVLRERAQQQFVALRASMLAVEATFKHEADVAGALIGVLAGDDTVTKIVEPFDVTGERVRLNNVLDSYETRRREARLSLWRLLLSEGCTINDVSRMFGLSRQLVSRQLNAASSPDPAPEPTLDAASD